MFAVVVLSALFTICLIHQLWWKRRHLPPGPMPMPLIGNMIEFARCEPGYDAFTKYAKEYGPLYTFWLGGLPAVVVTDFNLMQEMFVKDANSYVGRVQPPMTILVRGGAYGVIETDGDLWLTQRRFALHVLRDFGLGKNLMEKREPKILVEVNALMEDLHGSCKLGEIVDVQDKLDAAIGSVINTLLFGYRYDETNMKEFLALKHCMSQMMEHSGTPVAIVLQHYPVFGKLPYIKEKQQEVMDTIAKMFEMFRKDIREHEKHINYDTDDYSDFTEAFLKEMRKTNADPSFCHGQLENMCFDLWLAGMETTSNTLYWGILFMLLNKEAQRKVHEEMNELINSDRQITLEDKPLLHYTNAVVAEVQRSANLLPLNVIHKTTRDVVVNGFHIPKGTAVVPQICAALYDEKVFPEPLRFNPSRHLDEKGHFVKIDQLVPFSMGKRQCLGEGLARAELFLFLANFFNQFEISPENPKNPPSAKKHFGATVKAKNYSMRLKARY